MPQAHQWATWAVHKTLPKPTPTLFPTNSLTEKKACQQIKSYKFLQWKQHMQGWKTPRREHGVTSNFRKDNREDSRTLEMTERAQGREQDTIKNVLHSETKVRRAEPTQLGRLSSSQSHLSAPAPPLCHIWKGAHKSYALKSIYCLPEV